MIVGIDEVGRGPWAGPLVFGAVVLGGGEIAGLTDSKKLSKKQREKLDVEIREKAIGFGLGWVSAEELDDIGMSKACELGCRRALEAVNVPYTDIVLDGTVNFLKDTGKGPYVNTVKQADLLVPSVSAASIIAKVARDNYMVEQDKNYPGYGFGSHVGYGTKQHLEALKTLGVTPLHRKSFAPIAGFLGVIDVLKPKKSIDGTTRDTGNKSEDAAVKYLEKHGYEVIERNWKTKLCEIDIIARKAKKLRHGASRVQSGTLYFIEVKHRKNDRQGGGLAAITKKKLQQMTFAAKLYAHHIRRDEIDMRLAIITTQGCDISSVEFMIIGL